MDIWYSKVDVYKQRAVPRGPERKKGGKEESKEGKKERKKEKEKCPQIIPRHA